jgi:hypothetical protein
MAVLNDASAASLHPFVTGNVEPGTRIITNARHGYRGLDGHGGQLIAICCRLPQPRVLRLQFRYPQFRYPQFRYPRAQPPGRSDGAQAGRRRHIRHKPHFTTVGDPSSGRHAEPTRGKPDTRPPRQSPHLTATPGHSG